MRAVVFTGEVETVDDVELGPVGPTDVVVRIAAAGVCRSDLSLVEGTIGSPRPVVLGHEGAGVVEEVGAAVTAVAPGDHVVLVTLANCGRCRACAAGHPTLCANAPTEPAARFSWRGQPTYQFANTSVFVERTVVNERQAVKIDPAVPLDRAALLGCGVLTGAGAVFNRARVGQGDAVAVIGVGGVGLNAIQAARLSGATTIVAVDAIPSKESFATDFGATHFVDAGVDDVPGALREIVPAGFDFTFECVGKPAVLRMAVEALAPGGSCVIVGYAGRGVDATFEMTSLYQDKAILGCRYGSSRPDADIPMLVDLYLAGRLKLDELVTRTYPLESVEQVFEDMEAGALARGVLVP
jgi:S-(hydroxymethyl)glutathione dehydrogenase/alcohol dehydrogenase